MHSSRSGFRVVFDLFGLNALLRSHRILTGLVDALADWIHAYNHHRNHTAIGGPPISRATNVGAQHT